VSWAGLTPTARQSGPVEGRGKKGRGNTYVKRISALAAYAAANTDTFLGERFGRLAQGDSREPRTGTRLATDGGPGAVMLTACHFPGRKPRPSVSAASEHVVVQPEICLIRERMTLLTLSARECDHGRHIRSGCSRALWGGGHGGCAWTSAPVLV